MELGQTWEALSKIAYRNERSDLNLPGFRRSKLAQYLSDFLNKINGIKGLKDD